MFQRPLRHYAPLKPTGIKKLVSIVIVSILVLTLNSHLHVFDYEKPSEENIGVGVSNINSTCPFSVDSYPEWAVNVIRDELGDRLLWAMYDPEYLVEASISSAKGVHLFPVELEYNWNISKIRDPPTVPSPMGTVPGKLLMLKRCMSLGLGRMVQDGRLAEDYRKILKSSESPSEASPSTTPECRSSDARHATSLKSLAKSIRAIARGYGSYTVTFLQLIVDGENGSAMTELRELVSKKTGVTRGMDAADGSKKSAIYNDKSNTLPDPLLDIMGLLRIATKRNHSGTTSLSTKMKKLLMSITEKVFATETQTDVLRGIEKEAETIWNSRLEVLNALYDQDDKDNTVSKSPLSRFDTRKHSSCFHYKSHMQYITRSQYAVRYMTNKGYGMIPKEANGEFWNTIRPVLGCGSIVKLCEAADGCRYFCNLNYLLGADTMKQSSAFLPPTVIASPRAPFTTAANVGPSDEWRPYYHQVIGFGSNNEYDWEVALIEAFDRGQPHANRIGKMTVFDCTVKKWTPPAELIGSAASDKLLSTVIDFGHASFCIGAVNSPSASGTSVRKNSVTHRVKRKDLASIEFASLKKLLTNKDPELARSLGFETKRYNSHPVDGDVGRSDDSGGEGVDRRGGVNYDLFDEVSIMKIDIEGYEHVTFPLWVSAELGDIGAGLLQQNSSSVSGNGAPPSGETLLFFDKLARNMYTISQIGMELHRRGHKAIHGASYIGAMRTHYTLMHLYSLGFVMFGQERNPYDVCCYEVAFTHYRHYARSEGWQMVVA
eukprot:Tbor_TRINITY_DN5842_c0_g1::TRINITY_DN5842_c0_g1_i1::g.7029::m.7029